MGLIRLRTCLALVAAALFAVLTVASASAAVPLARSASTPIIPEDDLIQGTFSRSEIQHWLTDIAERWMASRSAGETLDLPGSHTPDIDIRRFHRHANYLPEFVMHELFEAAPLANPAPLAVRAPGRGGETCLQCQAKSRALQEAYFTPEVGDFMREMAYEVCLKLKIYPPHVCAGAVELFSPAAIEIIGHTVFEPAERCARLALCEPVMSPSLNITLPMDKPPVDYTPPNPRGNIKRILHLTDLHIDHLYATGLEADCPDPICCRPRPDDGTPLSRPAGPFGDYNCDAPMLLMESMLEYIRDEFSDVDTIFWTGDIPPHDVWASEKQAYLTLMDNMAELFHTILPNVTVLGAIGNHESVPADLFPPVSYQKSEFSISWLYQELAQQWSRWLGPRAQEQLRHGGSFLHELDSKTLVLSLNDEVCATHNLWLRMKDDTPGAECCREEFPDPDEMLGWLARELGAAERRGQRVFILRHIPNGSGCHPNWSQAFRDILIRFEGVVAGVFSGHTHHDFFEVYYRGGTAEGSNPPSGVDPSRPWDDSHLPREPAVVGFIAPSGAPLDGMPSFRVYDVDWDTRKVVNFQVHYADIAQGNAVVAARAEALNLPLDQTPVFPGDLHWIAGPDARAHYGLRDVSAVQLDALARRMARIGDPEGDDLFERFYHQYRRQNALGSVCNDSCRNSLTCRLRYSVTTETCAAV
ncbi:hypothetical protein H696_01041 [Fonticula alba]|uniref:Sphingomyelin phosphodiesterase n=1 Tax=Fonticula alba TaxID=691883 RepID=A0A058ZB23_FONAL|nr:hypothetical protein H696_01041 [Fonticula alba]KCV71625.1 hypothetical protein H696_01041 [Fonticula alba]|eukprot:XP_009493203.1 hypothetical protein H696_01041 [Fonticula alba]